MNKKIWVCIFTIILVIITVFCINNANSKKINYTIEKLGEQNYYLLMENNKYGVINKAGEVIIKPIYDVIEMPNPSKPIFVCKDNYNEDTKEYNIQVLNEEAKPILYQYYMTEAIKLKNVSNNGNYEKNVLTYKSNDKYGLIDINGKQIVKPIYDSIEGFDGNEGLLLVKKNGKYGIININGATIVKEKYDEIKSDLYSNKDFQTYKSGFIVGTRTDKGMRYGYIEPKKRKQILKNEYNEIYRICEKDNDDKIYIVAFKDGKAGIYENKKKIIDHLYEDIFYNEKNDLLVLQKLGKQGVFRFDNTQVLPLEFENIIMTGDYINALNGENVEVYDINGKKQDDSSFVSKTKINNKFEIVLTKEGRYIIKNLQDNIEINEQYSFVQYLYNDYFIVMKDSKFGVINGKGEKKLDFKYNSIQRLENYNIIQAFNEKSIIELYDENINFIVKSDVLNVNYKDSFIEIYNNNDIIYTDYNGKILVDTDIFKDNNIIAFKEKKKWGYKNKNGEIVVPAKYDFAANLNKYGYGAVRIDNRWMSVDSNGQVLEGLEYELDTQFPPIFFKQYYEVDMNCGEIYFTL